MRSYAQHIIMYFVSSENEVTFMQKNCYIQWRGAMRAKDHVSLMVTKYSWSLTGKSVFLFTINSSQ